MSESVRVGASSVGELVNAVPEGSLSIMSDGEEAQRSQLVSNGGILNKI